MRRKIKVGRCNMTNIAIIGIGYVGLSTAVLLA